ncbi:MAG: hypothetical protein ACREVE_05245 [Gammaproteobacteria bacterium]
MLYAVDEVGSLKVFPGTRGVNETRRFEAEFFKVHQWNAPVLPLDALPTVSASRLSGGRALGTVYARQAPVRDTEFGGRYQKFSVVQVFVRQGLEERFRAFVSCAKQMKPKRHLTLAEHVWYAFSEPEFALRDLLVTAATLGTTARRCFDDVGHRCCYARVNTTSAL